MPKLLGWQSMKEMSARLLVDRTGEDLASWNQRIIKQGLSDEKSLREWLSSQGVTGYAQSILVMEQFGYPDFMLASAEDLIDGQYADRPQLRIIFDTIVGAAAGFGEMAVQARKTYVSLVTTRRTFARVQPATKSRVDLCLRLDGQKPGGRLVLSKLHETTPLQIRLTSPDEVDDEVINWLHQAYQQSV